MSLLKNLFLIIPVMLYYFIESLISGLAVMFLYDYFLLSLTGFEITYKQWVVIIWIIKIIFFDVFKFNHVQNNVFEEENNEEKKENNEESTRR